MRDEDNREIDRLRERYERENRGECEHGYLNRQCNTCELESALIEARAEIFRLSGSLDVGDRVIASSEHKLAAARAEIERLDLDRKRLDLIIERGYEITHHRNRGEWTWIVLGPRYFEVANSEDLRLAIDAVLASSEAEGGE